MGWFSVVRNLVYVVLVSMKSWWLVSMLCVCVNVVVIVKLVRLVFLVLVV